MDVSSTILNVVLLIASVLTFLYNFDVNISAFLIAIGTTLLALSFAYAKTIQEVFDSLYLLFFGE